MAALGNGGTPLAGVLHGAAVLDDGTIVRQSPERLAAVMAQKADGAWRLHRALERRGISPEFFALYSSMSAVFGSPGQAGYVAANAFLDAMARHRRVRDQSGCSVAWGAWKEVGMAARGATAERAAASGFGALPPAAGMHAFGLVLREDLTHVAVSPIDWGQVLRQTGDAALPILSDLLREAQAARGRPKSEGRASAKEDFGVMQADERLARLQALVRHELATVLALPDGGRSIVDDQPFSSHGLDSLTSVELRNRLQAAVGRPVSATAAFEWPTVGELASHLASFFADATPAESAREEVTL